MHYILFPIGDWSCDGHNCSADFIVQSNKPLQYIREVHFKENSFFGELCSSYEDNKISVFKLYSFLLKYISATPAQQFIKNFIQKGLTLTDDNFELEEIKSRVYSTPNNYSVSLSFEHDPDNIQSLVVDDPILMLDIWISCLNIMDLSLNLTIVSVPMSSHYIKYKGYPFQPEGSIHFAGIDSQKRHLETPGYGIWQEFDTEFNRMES